MSSMVTSPITSPVCKTTLKLCLSGRMSHKLPQLVETQLGTVSVTMHTLTQASKTGHIFIPATPTQSPLTDSETFRVQSSSAFFSRELTHSLRFCLQRDAAARFLSRKRCLRSSGSSSTVRRRRPPVGCAGDT